jgi:peptide deformylase
VLLTVVTYGNEVLRQKAVPVAAITDEIRALTRDMLESMYAARGVGLAAEQVGRTECLCVIDIPPDAEKEECVAENAAVEMPLTMVNPEIVSVEGKQRNEEGCLSFPEISAQITRADRVTVAYTDLAGVRQTIKARGLLARAIQHEVDHLNGVLLVDKMSPMQRVAVSGKLKRLQKTA